LGRNTTDQIGKRNFAFDSKSKENNDPQLSTPSNFIKKTSNDFNPRDSFKD